ncbi:monocarboxylate transporter 10 isoform X1 [Amyelois transitella]|uniref:monocarboxylate transporter 10 isoform X1 n=1 Tax=Amyelois transitella TaxID=680683 RepID=UPI0029901BEA|nr:monocarboxylate transporter 10 isoform X1 [Amyelois transitella]
MVKKESTDLLTGRQLYSGQKLSSYDGDVPNDPANAAPCPPDGGYKAYIVMVASFLTNGIIFGVINSFSVIFTELEYQLKQDGLAHDVSRASLVGALTMGTTFFLSPLSGVLTAFMGLRLTAVCGGLIATAGLIISSFVTKDMNALCFTYGIMYGLGASFAYTPSLAILGHYFKKKLGLVNGIVTIGSSIFTVFMAPLMEYVIKNYGLHTLFRVLAVLTFGIALCGMLFKPIVLVPTEPSKKHDNFQSLLKTILSVQMWRNKTYKLWALSMPVALFGYFVPYTYIKSFIKQNFGTSYENLPLQCIAAASGVGRLIFGYLADKKGVDRIMLQQISFYVIGTLTIVLPFVTSFELLVAISLGMGIFDGAFIALIGPIAFELCGSKFAAQAIGCMLGLAAFPLTIGPPVAGHLYSIYNSYTLPFILAGVSPILGATLMFTIRFYKHKSAVATNTNGHLPLNERDIEKTRTSEMTCYRNSHERADL